jgi:serine/threonine-protein kinase HipA
MKSLVVSVSDTVVGKLEQSRSDGHFFDPEQRWIALGQRPVLGLYYRQNLTVRPSVAKSTHLPVWFENLLPEQGSELRRILCEQLSLRTGQSFALLAALGVELPGAVVLSRLDMQESGFFEPDIERMPLAGLRFSSLAGNQLKFSMARDGSGFTLPAKSGEAHWIIKIPSADMPNLPEIEHTTMVWARACGREIPYSEVVPMDSVFGLESFVRKGIARVFAIERFDRLNDGSRVHQEDFAQVFNLMPEHKYGDSGPLRAGISVVAKLVRDACSEREFSELVARIAFMIASGNGDAHLKNWSFVYRGNNVIPQLSPCYDQVCTIACDPIKFGWDYRGGPRLALRFPDAKRFAEVSNETIRKLGGKLGMDENDFEEQFIAELKTAKAAWSEVSENAPAGMRQELHRHWLSVPLLERLGGLEA